MKILLAGLEEESAGMVGGWLREAGHGVERCGPGEERLAANRVRPDLVLAHLGAPEGLSQFVGWLRARPRLAEARVIAVLSGGASGAAEWIKAGASEVLMSPVGRAELEGRLAVMGAAGAGRDRLERAEADAAQARAELESVRRLVQETREGVSEAERERARVAEELKRAREELEQRGGRTADLERQLDDVRQRLEKALGDLAAETKRASELVLGAGRAGLLEKEVDDLRVALAELHEKHKASEARASADGAVTEALDKARSELRALRVEFSEAQRVPVRLFESVGAALPEGLMLMEQARDGEEPKVIFANPGAERLTGRKRGEMVGEPLWFKASDVDLDWKSDKPSMFYREEPKEGGGTRRLRVEVMPVSGVVGGRALWAMVLTEEVSQVLVRAQGPSLPALLSSKPLPSAAGAGARRVLLARDAGGLNPRLAGVLRDAGYHVSTAEPNSGVMEKMQAGDFDLVVLEINRPGPGGPGMLRVMRQRLPAQRVMVVSRLLTLRQKQEVGRLGVSDVLTEELNGPELLGRVESVLGAPGQAPQVT